MAINKCQNTYNTYNYHDKQLTKYSIWVWTMLKHLVARLPCKRKGEILLLPSLLETQLMDNSRSQVWSLIPRKLCWNKYSKIWEFGWHNLVCHTSFWLLTMLLPKDDVLEIENCKGNILPILGTFVITFLTLDPTIKYKYCALEKKKCYSYYLLVVQLKSN